MSMDQQKISKFLFLAFAILIGVSKFWFHELWKDEWQAWFVASDQSLLEILSFLNYEGHPALWYLYLKGLSGLEFLFVDNPEWLIQIGHYILVLAMGYVFFLKFKMHWILKLVFALSYFMSFEYSIVNRGYVLVILLSYWITYLMHEQTTITSNRKWIIPVLLFLLCQTEVYGVLLAGGFVSYLLISSFKSYKTLGSTLKKHSLHLIGLFTGLGIFVLTVFPRGNRDDFSRAYVSSFFDGDAMLDAFQGLWANNFLIGSIPDTSANGWSSLGLILSILVMLSMASVFWKRKKLLIVLGVTFLAFYLFAVNIYNGGIRQWGMLFMFFICLVELANFHSFKKYKFHLLPILVFSIFHTIHSAKSFYTDFTQPFTNAEKAGLFLKENVPQNVPIITAHKFESTPVIGYADRAFYELPSGEPFTYFKWLEKIYLTTEEELALFAKFKKVAGIIYVSPEPIDVRRFPKMQEWKVFSDPNYKRENYYIYSLQF